MEDVIISIQPQWVEKIATGKKTIEVRKTAPKCEVPFKCYIYVTKGKPYLYRVDDDDNFELTNTLHPKVYEYVKDYNEQNGKLIGEFICDRIDKYPYNKEFGYEISEESFNKTMLTADEFCNYGKGKPLYGWHISDLKIYDKPKELSKFWTVKCTNNYKTCGECKDKPKCIKTITRPPQSWCYVKGENQ